MNNARRKTIARRLTESSTPVGTPTRALAWDLPAGEKLRDRFDGALRRCSSCTFPMLLKWLDGDPPPAVALCTDCALEGERFLSDAAAGIRRR